MKPVHARFPVPFDPLGWESMCLFSRGYAFTATEAHYSPMPCSQRSLSADTSFAQPLASEQAPEASAILPKPKPGNCWLRVTGFGAETVEGPASPPPAVKIEWPT